MYLPTENAPEQSRSGKYIILILQSVLVQYPAGSQHHIHEPRGVSAHAVFAFLPQKREVKQLGQIGTNQVGARRYSTRNV